MRKLIIATLLIKSLCIVSSQSSSDTALPGDSDEVDNTSDCGTPSIIPNILRTRVVGGKQVTPHSYPWHVSVKMSQARAHCGGSIISIRLVLTAAHCFFIQGMHYSEFNVETSRFKIVVGKHVLSESEDHEQEYNAQKIIVHPRFDRQGAHDIAMVMTSRRIRFNRHVQPVCLWDGPLDYSLVCAVVGWGETNGSGDKNVLNQAVLPQFNTEKCREIYSAKNYRLSSGKMCAGGEEGVDACYGDSGGGLVCIKRDVFYVVGIASGGIGCGSKGIPGVYTEVAEYMSFINDTITKYNY